MVSDGDPIVGPSARLICPFALFRRIKYGDGVMILTYTDIGVWKKMHPCASVCISVAWSDAP